MEQNEKTPKPDMTAVSSALWRALHVQLDAPPHVLKDEIGSKLIALQDDSRKRSDTKLTRRLRASIIARARFIEDLIIEQSNQGISQYVILGAGLDTFTQRRRDIASKLQIYEIDKPDTLKWKQQRLIELNFGVPEYLHFVPFDVETSSWTEQLLKAGFESNKPAVVACTGVTAYLTKEAITSMLCQIATFATGSIVAITFYLPIEFLDEEDQLLRLIGMLDAQKAGAPFISFFTPNEILAIGREAGFKEAKIVSTKDMDYFNNRIDSLVPASGEIFLLATI
jgi:methyltransferase (TIGR00027 family)